MEIFWIVAIIFGTEPETKLVDDFVGTYDECVEHMYEKYIIPTDTPHICVQVGDMH